MGDDYAALVKPFQVKCLVMYDELIKYNSHLQIRRPNDLTNDFKKPRQPPAIPKPGTAAATRNKPNSKKKKVIDVKHILHDTRGIETRDYVDDTMVCFLPEFCHRIGLKQMPRDPMELCKNFTLTIPDCGPLIEDTDNLITGLH